MNGGHVDPGVEARKAATFTLVDGAPSNPLRLEVAAVDDPTQLLVDLPWEADVPAQVAELVRGRYLAAVSRGEWMGPIAEFEIGADPVFVELQGTDAFDWTWNLLDDESTEPVSAARVEIRRLDRLGDSPENARIAESDAVGRVFFAGCSAGEYEVNIEREGYERKSKVLRVPGVYEPWLEGGVLDIRHMYLLPVHSIGFELVGEEDWGGAERFMLAVQDTSRRGTVPFSSDGTARVELAGLGVPLATAVDYPDGTRQHLYFGAGYQVDGKPNKIDVRKQHTLRVDLRVSPDLVEQVFGSHAGLQVNYRSDRFDSVELSQAADGTGVYEFTGPLPEHASVSFTVVTEGGPSVWAVQEVAVDRGSDATEVLLNVVARPVRICVTDGGEAVDNAALFINLIPNRTGWVGGGYTEAGNCTEIPRIHGDRCALSCFVEDELRAIDVPLSLEGGTEAVPFDLKPSFHVDFEVLLDGSPVANRGVLVRGEVSTGVDGAQLFTRDTGVTPPLELVSGSRALVSPLADPGEWVIDERVAVTGGRILLRLSSTGELRAGTRGAFSGVRTSAGTTLGEWVESGRTTVEAVDGGGFSVRVPVGTYLHPRSDGTEEAVLVQPDKSTWLP